MFAKYVKLLMMYQYYSLLVITGEARLKLFPLTSKKLKKALNSKTRDAAELALILMNIF